MLGRATFQIFLLLLLCPPPLACAEDSYFLSQPEVFDLQIPSDLFTGRLRWDKEQKTCHMQGLQMTEDKILISCVLYNPKRKLERAYKSESFLLGSQLDPVLYPKPGRPPQWDLQRLTEPVPPTENDRLAKVLFNGLPPYGGKSLSYSLGHPSGLFLNRSSGVVWLANSLYGPYGYTRILIYRPSDGKLRRTPFVTRDHLGAVFLARNRFLIGFSWNSDDFVALDLKTGRWRTFPNSLPEKLDYQDCTALGVSTFLCGGKLKLQEMPVARQIGRIHLLHVSGETLDTLSIELKSKIRASLAEGDPLTADLGRREYSYREGMGDQDRWRNRYGPYVTHLPLTNNGLSASPDLRYLYFLPEDIPGGKLIRYRLNQGP